jgi:hypothetical protein
MAKNFSSSVIKVLVVKFSLNRALFGDQKKVADMTGRCGMGIAQS